MALIIPKNNAEEKTLDATLKIYYDANDWVTNEVLIDKLSYALDNLGIEEEKKEPQSYTKKTQVLAYYGFIVWEDETNSQSKRKITELGKRFYEAKSRGDSSHIIETLIESLNKCTFGRNVTGCNSDSDLEPPNIFLKSALLLDGLNLNEFAYILQKMEFDNAELADAIFDISLHRKMGQPVSPNDQAAKWKDPKPILALGNWGLFSVEKKNGLNSYCLNKYVIENYSKELMALRTKNTETLRFVMKGIDDNYNGNSEGLQIIYYGAPGTGKSHEIKQQTAEAEKEGRVFRTTFHPDSDYSTFVGCYKPTMKPTGVTLASGEKEEIIAYKFVPQAFTNAYVKAWQTTEPVYLIIEEINRGNCAQIFGDLFQLLDRGDNGQSDYPIKADTDLAEYLKETLGNEHEGIAEGKLKLPLNLYIWATMNTSDQSLFPIDSAFKRRWDWKYVPIRKGVDDNGETINWDIEANKKTYDWWEFLQAINNKIEQATNSEDKKLGFFFCKAQNGIIDAKTFVSKVVFYLWNDVFKDFVDDSGDLFKDTDDSRLTFTKFYDVDDNGKPVMEAKVEQFLKNLGVPANEYEDDSADEDIEDGSYFINGVECKKYRHIYKNSIEAYLKNFPDKTVEEVIKDWGTINTGLLCTQNEYEEIVRTRKITNPVIETRFTPIEYKGEKLFINFTKAKATKEKIEPDIELINSKDWGIHIEKK